MKKLVSLIVVVFMVMAVFLVGCTKTVTEDVTGDLGEDAIEVVDEDGALVGEAFRYAPMKYKVTKDSYPKLLKQIVDYNRKYCLPSYAYVDPFKVTGALPSEVDQDANYLCLEMFDTKENPLEYEDVTTPCGTMGYIEPEFGLFDISGDGFSGKAYVCFFEP